MYLVVKLCISDETVRIGVVVNVIELGNRVHCSHRIDIAAGLPPNLVSVEAVGAAVIDGLGGIVVDGRTDSALVGVLVVSVCSLSVKVDSKVIVKESRSKVQGSRGTVHLGTLEGTGLGSIASGHAVRKERTELSVDADITVIGLSVLPDKALPVSVLTAESLEGGTVHESHGHAVSDEGTHLVAGQHIVILGNRID